MSSITNLPVRMTTEQYALISQAAEKLGLKTSTYMRMVTLACAKLEVQRDKGKALTTEIKAGV